MESEIIRKRSREMKYEWRKQRLKLAGRIIKSLAGLGLSSKKTNPEERKKEIQERLQAWARDPLAERGEAFWTRLIRG